MLYILSYNVFALFISHGDYHAVLEVLMPTLIITYSCILYLIHSIFSGFTGRSQIHNFCKRSRQSK